MSSSPCHAVINIIEAQHHQNAAAKKKVAFDALYALDSEGDDTEDEGLADSLQKVKGRTLGDPTTSLSRSRRTADLQAALHVPSRTSTYLFRSPDNKFLIPGGLRSPLNFWKSSAHRIQ
jgi:hypothetical protein